MYKKQNGVCFICKKKQSVRDGRYGFRKALAVDHDVETGKNRALLCDLCNRALGQFKENPEVLRRAARYVIFWKKKHKGSPDDSRTDS